MLEKFKEVKDFRWLKRYLYFINKFKINNVKNKENTHNHHIMPKSLYPEFKDFKKHPWNLAILTYRCHLISHYMLARALGCNMWFAYNNMNAYGERLNSILYECAMIEFKSVMSNQRKGLVSVKNTLTNENLLVTKKEFEENEHLVGITKGLFNGDKNVSKNELTKQKISIANSNRIHVLDIQTGNRKFIKENEFNDEFEIIKPFSDNTGFTAVKTEHGIKRVSVEEFKQNNLEHFNKGIERTTEVKNRISESLKGVKKNNTENYNKFRILISPNGEEYKFLGSKTLKEYCVDNNLSHSRLEKFKNQKVPDNTNTQIRGYTKVMNTTGWELIV